MKYKIYHNPKCSKCRSTLEILNNKGLDITIVEYLNNPPSKEELKGIIEKLKIHPSELIRFKEDKAKELKISAKDEFSFEKWLTIISENPVLIERPIVVSEREAVIGRPPENVLSLIEDY